jgi:hypothetical protein
VILWALHQQNRATRINMGGSPTGRSSPCFIMEAWHLRALFARLSSRFPSVMLVGIDEDLSFYEGAGGGGSNLANMQEAVKKI